MYLINWGGFVAIARWMWSMVARLGWLINVEYSCAHYNFTTKSSTQMLVEIYNSPFHSGFRKVFASWSSFGSNLTQQDAARNIFFCSFVQKHISMFQWELFFCLILHLRPAKTIIFFYQQTSYPRFIQKILRKQLHLSYYIFTCGAKGARWMALRTTYLRFRKIYFSSIYIGIHKMKKIEIY